LYILHFKKKAITASPKQPRIQNSRHGDYLDVSHLGTRHFHYFHFKVWVEVSHLNRDIEFIQLRRWIEQQYETGALELNNQSCEMLADGLVDILKDKYPDQKIKVDVSEEGINGAIVEYSPVDLYDETLRQGLESLRTISK